MNPDDNTVLYANRVEKTYSNGTRALDEVRLKIQRGDFVSLLGPSSCGKSTLFKMFAGLEQASAGQVLWWNQGFDAVGRSGRKIAMAFQEATLMPWARIAPNVRLSFDLEGLPQSESMPRVEAALKSVGLEKFGHVYPHELSSGMQMRASIARALATQLDVLLMDEPFGALDEFTRNKFDADLRELWASKDLTVVFVTHSIYEAVYLSNRVVVMAARPGRILEEVEIQGPDVCDEAFRVSSEFVGYCKQLSDLLTQANQVHH
ncbi:MAG: ABC transporter ATP-binding protein [Candidatus Protistobacter heckmanni]|nr:ABC transporter ATP-binding protein [Candidatus Protistobacter heckmanni]